ncbi:hypothetical protein F7D14_13960 [Methylocystis parvus]|uniref:Uncharacterized protein n=1 Tax=Methylocystis parvus TaxID=134 RepID=A0A6B8M7I8_9HYPH|nr:hypothetical protein F7D14_13960 [Methylocystis parvus]
MSLVKRWRRRVCAPMIGPWPTVTPGRAVFLSERLEEKFAERQAAKADFAPSVEEIALDPRQKAGFSPHGPE